MRKLLLTMAAAILMLSANAQGFKAQRFEGRLDRANATVAQAPSANKAPRKADLAANQRLAGNYISDSYASSRNGLGITGAPGTLGAYTYWPASVLQPYVGSQLTQIRYALANSATVSAVTLYGVTDDQVVELATQAVKNGNNSGWNTITLDSPWTVTTDGYSSFLIGYTYTQTSSTQDVGSFPLSFVLEGTIQSTYIYGDLGQGAGFYNLGAESYGNLSVQAIVEGEFPTNGVAPSDFGAFSVAAGKTKKVNVTFNNVGTSLSNFDYTVTVNGQTGDEQHVDLGTSVLGVGGSYSDSVSFTAPAEGGTYPVSVNVTKVNGEANGSSVTSGNGTMYDLAKEFKRGVVVEEFTGTGCGWCPRGLAGMKKLAETYPDNFVGVGIHQYNSSDPMYTSNYANLGFTGAPSCMINRSGNAIDPYYGSNSTSITDDFAKQLEDLPVLGVEVAGQWNSDSTAVSATATVDPLVSGNYNIDFVLVADSLTGSSTSWNQSNYYSQYTAAQAGATDDPDIAQFCRGGAYGKSSFKWPFDDVLIASSYMGTRNQATLAALTEGTKTDASYQLTLPTKTILKNAINKSKVYVIAIVYNDNGVANAAKASISAYSDPTGIQNVNAAAASDSEVVARYNAAGQRIASAQPGLNIVKYANGKTVKVLVK